MASPEYPHPTYAESFRLFLDSTDEKNRITQSLAKYGIQNGGSLLDIGAGNGDLAMRLQDTTQPSRYVAIEQNLDFTPRLRELGLDVVPGTYPDTDPLLLDSSFDSVLSSYSTPLVSEARREFVTTAFARTAPEGKMSLISFGDPDQWTDISDEIAAKLLTVTDPAESPTRPVADTFVKELQEEYANLGYTETHTITSEIIAPTREKLVHAIAFIATGGSEELLKQYYTAEEEVAHILESQAPHNRITQNHSFITISRKRPDER